MDKDELIKYYKRGKTPPSVLRNVQGANRRSAEPYPTESPYTGWPAPLPKWINFETASVNLDQVCSIELHGSRIDIFFDPKLSSHREITFRSNEGAQEAFAKIQRALGRDTRNG